MICYCLLLVLVTLLATLSCGQTWKKVEKGASDRAREFFENVNYRDREGFSLPGRSFEGIAQKT